MELYHYGVKGMKWGVHRTKQTNYKIGKVGGSGPTKDGGKYYEYHYSLSGKKRYPDGRKGNSGINSNGGVANTRKEAKKIAKRELVKDLNKEVNKGNTEYESRQVKKFRNKVQKQAKKEYEKAEKAYDTMKYAYLNSVERSGYNSVSSMKLQTLSVLAKQDYEQAGRSYVDLLTKEQKKKKQGNRFDEYTRKAKEAAKKYGYESDEVVRYNDLANKEYRKSFN